MNERKVTKEDSLTPDVRFSLADNRHSKEGGLSVVQKEENEPVGKMLWRFRKKMFRFGFWDEIKKRKFYTKPTDKRRAAEKVRKLNVKIANRMYQNK